MSEARARVAVVGSINRDLMIRTPKLPGEGETVIGTRLETMHGGKGANQAVAAAMASGPGTEVFMVGAVGSDDYGEEEIRALAEAGVHVDHTATLPQVATGTAFVVVDDSGSNQIVVIPGANGEVTPSQVQKALRDVEPTVVLISLEIPVETMEAAVEAGHDAGACVVLNPAPFHPLSGKTWEGIQVVVPNRIEFLQLVAGPLDAVVDEAAVRRWLRRRGLDRPGLTYIVTLGADGAILSEGSRVSAKPAPKVTVTDTTGAGDAFNGALAGSIAGGMSMEEATESALRFASAAVTVDGARVPPWFAGNFSRAGSSVDVVSEVDDRPTHAHLPGSAGEVGEP